jgi:DNA replication initiation complex subunit (GINS family)
MDLEKEYNKLYDYWLKEFESTELAPLLEENFKNFQKLIREINNHIVNYKEQIKAELFSSYKKNINYLFNDFLKIREIKLINAALSLQEIDYNNVIEVEKLFFQNLISAIKGFKKLKAFSLYEDIEISDKKDFKEEDKELIKKSEEKEGKLERLKEIVEDEPLQSAKLADEKQKLDYNYTLIRFTKKAPPLLGVDLIKYGPFQENDIANLPYKNASILIHEKFAEKIDLT